MCRACSHEHLVAFTLGDVRGWRAVRLKRHIAVCPVCRAEHEILTQTTALARQFQYQEVPVTMQAHLWSSLSASVGQVTPARLLPRRLAVTLSLGAAMFLAFTFTHSRRANVAFGQVVKAVQSVRTVHYHQSMFQIDSKGVNTPTAAEGDCWVNWQPMMVSSRTHNALMEADEQRSIRHDLHTNRYETHPLTGDRPSLHDEILYEITAPDLEIHKDWQTQMIVADNRTLLQFQQSWSGTEARDLYTIWADPDSLRVVRVERRQYNIARGYTSYEIRDQFAYNEAPPADRFTLLARQSPGDSP